MIVVDATALAARPLELKLGEGVTTECRGAVAMRVISAGAGCHKNEQLLLLLCSNRSYSGRAGGRRRWLFGETEGTVTRPLA